MSEQTETQAVEFSGLMADIVSAYLSHNHVQPAEIPALIASVHTALVGLSQPSADELAASRRPTAAEVRKSITPDALISFIDGRPYKAIKRHLTTHGLDAKSYRELYGLPSDYPMTSANYSAARSALAYSFGLGRKRTNAANTNAPVDEVAAPAEPKRRGRPAKAVEAPVEAPKAHGRRKVGEQT